MDTLLRLAGIAERRDEATGFHLKRMAKYAGLIARGAGLSEKEVEEIELAAPMHDIGKIGIPDSIILGGGPGGGGGGAGGGARAGGGRGGREGGPAGGLQ